MQYIKKNPEPPLEWEEWFRKGNGDRSFDYKSDEQNLPNKGLAAVFLLQEQSGLCAYCQSSLTVENVSIEHVIPKSQNVSLSTCYHNLVAVCKSPQKDPDSNKTHCDKERGNKLLSPIIFYSNAQVDYAGRQNHAFFDAYQHGQIVPKPNLPLELQTQINAFIEILNLNHSVLMSKRGKDTLSGIMEIYLIQPTRERKREYLEVQLNRIAMNPYHPYRQFLMIYLAKKLGIN